MTEIEKITLTELQRVIRDRLYTALPGFYWVIAEIAEIKVNSAGHCYLELTGTDNHGGKTISRARATIWSNRFRSISAYFTSATGIPLSTGITILFKATVEYHELYGLSLNIADIDPAYTAGEMALKREAIIQRLTREGVMEMNRELEIPLYPRRIAIISSEKAAGFSDFVHQLASNPYHYVFLTTLYDAVMQGNETESSVIDALDRIAASNAGYDVVVIIRGGGSGTDLSWFDNYNIAFHVTQFPLPVLTGIGHEKDLSVTDMVAWRALKTPTAAADFIIDRTVETETAISEMASQISTLAEEVIEGHKERLLSLQNHITSNARMIVKVREERIGFYSESLRQKLKGIIHNGQAIIDKLDNSLRHLNPLSVLKRGFTLTTRKGIIIRHAGELLDGDLIVTHFEKDQVKSFVTETGKGKTENK